MRWLLIVAAAGAALIPIPAPIVERWYSRGFYPRLQPAVTGFSSSVTFALLDAATAILVCAIVIALVRSWRASTILVWLRNVLVGGLAIAAAVYLWFMLFWGLNYRRLPLERKLAYDPARISREQAATLARLAVDQVNLLAPQARSPANDDDALRSALTQVERMLGGTTDVRVASPKRSLLTWYFRKAAIDGMTNPFFLEIIVTPDLLPFERPYTLAHEWAHLSGYADESEANFIAWLACIRGTPMARYSGWLSAYQHLAAVLPREERKTLNAALSPVVVADLDAIRLRLSRASPAVSTAARGVYDTYLRANRIEEGIANYGAVVRLMLGTSFDAEWTPQLRDLHR